MHTFIRLAAATAALLGFQVITYFGSEKFQHDPRNVLTDIDRHIPFLPSTSFIYVLWFPLIAAFPLILFYSDTEKYAVYMTAMFIAIISSVTIYLIIPTSFTRPVPPDTLSGRFMKLIYTGSYRGLNCAPSLHCSSCMLIMLCSAASPGIPSWCRALCIIVSAGIIISTMTTKQHAFIDFATAIPVALICYALGMLFPARFIAEWICR